MFFGKYNHVVETFAIDTADYSFRVRILLDRVGSGDYFFDSHTLVDCQTFALRRMMFCAQFVPNFSLRVHVLEVYEE